MSVRTQPVTGLAAVMVAGLLLAACSSSGRAAAPRTPASTQHRVTPALTVTVAGERFAGLPAVVRPGVRTLRFDNTTNRAHMAAIGRLAGPHTAAQLLGYLRSPAGRQGLPPWLSLVGGVDELDPGQRGGWTGSLPAGRYVLASLSPDRTGRPEVLDGMLTPFTVSGRPVPDSPPPAVAGTARLGAGGTLTVTRLQTGRTALRVENGDGSPRMLDVTRIRSGRTYADVMREAHRGGGVPASLVRLGGTTVPPGATVVIDIEPVSDGVTYVLFDPEHVQQGAIVHETIA